MSDKWGPFCVKCGHPSGYHGVTFCMVDAGSTTKRNCDCDGYQPFEEPEPEPEGSEPGFHLHITATDNAAFDDNPALEVSRILARTAQDLPKFEIEGFIDAEVLYDHNGNRVGHWSYTPYPERGDP